MTDLSLDSTWPVYFSSKAALPYCPPQAVTDLSQKYPVSLR